MSPKLLLPLLLLALGSARAVELAPSQVLSGAFVSASNNGVDHQQSSQAGQAVGASGFGLLIRGVDGVDQIVAHTETSWAWAATRPGVNRVSVGAHGALIDRNTFDNSSGHWEYVSAYTHAQATSRSQDWLLVEGGSPGGMSSVRASGYIEYDLSWLTLSNGLRPTAWFQLFIGGSSATVYGIDSFLANADRGYFYWEHVFNVSIGQPAEFKVELTANIDANGVLQTAHMGALPQQIAGFFDASHTAVVTRFELAPGLNLSSGSGDLVALDGGWTYQASIDAGLIPGVPEPQSWALMGLGLALLGGRRLQRAGR